MEKKLHIEASCTLFYFWIYKIEIIEEENIVVTCV